MKTIRASTSNHRRLGNILLKKEIKHVYLISKELGRRFIGLQYHVLPSEELQRSTQPMGQMPERTMEQVRIIITTGHKNEVQGYNPTTPPGINERAWLYGKSPIIDLPWDPKDWSWKDMGDQLPLTNFFRYTTKRGYKIGLSKRHPTM